MFPFSLDMTDVPETNVKYLHLKFIFIALLSSTLSNIRIVSKCFGLRLQFFLEQMNAMRSLCNQVCKCSCVPQNAK